MILVLFYLAASDVGISDRHVVTIGAFVGDNMVDWVLIQFPDRPSLF